jgi:hypothetical protein
MKNGLVLFGDNACLSTEYMATPYTNVSGNKENVTKDDYFFPFAVMNQSGMLFWNACSALGETANGSASLNSDHLDGWSHQLFTVVA